MLVLEKGQGRHPDDEQIELFSLGILAGEAIPVFEQHVLICPACQDRVAEMDAGIQGMQAEARQVRADEMRRRGTTGSGSSSD